MLLKCLKIKLNFRIYKQIMTSAKSADPVVKSPLVFTIISECPVSRARVSKMTLPHGDVDLPVFMPVGTKGSLKGLMQEQLEDMGVQIMLGNTYHLGSKPGIEVLEKVGGLHNFMNWKRCLLTDSGGFQMVSLLKFAEITEEGVKFQPLKEHEEVMLTPEHSIQIQNSIGADIIMQLDDVIKTTSPDKDRIAISVDRTTRWLDRCLAAHRRPQDQVIFPIVQGTLYEDLREKSAQDHLQRAVSGFAVGGLSGGESKDDFWRMVFLCTGLLPRDKPRYLMGVGFTEDLLVCCALGVDMFDCVWPTRTARFGNALTNSGTLNLKKEQYKTDFSPIDRDCPCNTCKRYSRAYLNGIVTKYPVTSTLISEHNIMFQLRLMSNIRSNVKNGTFPKFVADSMLALYPARNYPNWIRDALKAVNIKLH